MEVANTNDKECKPVPCGQRENSTDAGKCKSQITGKFLHTLPHSERESKLIQMRDNQWTDNAREPGARTWSNQTPPRNRQKDSLKDNHSEKDRHGGHRSSKQKKEPSSRREIKGKEVTTSDRGGSARYSSTTTKQVQKRDEDTGKTTRWEQGANQSGIK